MLCSDTPFYMILHPWENYNKSCCSIFTTRIRRMMEGNVFTLSTISGGVTPFQVWVRGVPHPQSGWVGDTHPWSGWGYPVPGQGVPHPRSGWGTLSQVWGTPSHVWMGGTPGTPTRTGLGTPHHQDWMGYPTTRTGWGTLHHQD